MIKRDRYGLLVQGSPTDPTYEDGGDSCSRDGILAGCGVSASIQVMHDYVVTSPPYLVRHPYQPEWNDFTKTSRDNVVCYAFGIDPKDPMQLNAVLKYARGWFVNKDFLFPDVRLYLYKCAQVKAPLHIRLLGYPMLFLSLVWNTKVLPNEELNQFTCICIRMGHWWAQKLLAWHPCLDQNLENYWDNWRDQTEIGDALQKEILARSGVILP